MTPRQRAVMELVALGLTDPQIADRMGIREGTVGAHVGAVLVTLKARTRAHAVAILDDVEPGWRKVAA